MPFKIPKLRHKTYNVLRTHPSGRERNCGFFDKLPPELLHYIFRFLSLPQIGQLSLVSEAFRSKVTMWIWTSECHSRALRQFSASFSPEFTIPGQISTKSMVLPQYLKMGPALDEFGILVKRLTCLSHTQDRINFAFTAFDYCLRRHCHLLEEHIRLKKLDAISGEWVQGMHFFQFTRMMHTFTKGWDSVEFDAILQQMEISYKISADISEILNSSNMTEAPLETELRLRFILRTLTWDVTGEDYSERADWLMAIIKYYIGIYHNSRAQATLFLLAFGIGCDDSNDHYKNSKSLSLFQRGILDDLHNHTDWDCLTESVPEDFHEGKKMFLTLAQAICSCMQQKRAWKEEMLSSVLNDMFSIPTVWLRENIAAFLLFCSENVILHYVGGMILDGEDCELEKAATLIIDMIVMSNRFDNELSSEKGVGRVFDKLCEIGDSYTRRRFHEKIWDIIANIFEENWFFETTNENGEIDILKEFGLHLMHKAYGNIPVITKDEDEVMEIEE